MKYDLKRSFKTRILNVLRHLFRIRFLEETIRSHTEKNPNHLFRKLIAPDYLYPSGSFRYIERGGIRYKLDISHVVDHYIYFGFRDADYRSVISEIMGASIILDIGANIGTTSLYFASLNRNARILAFEPDPYNYMRAKENLELNGFANIELRNIGLGQKNEQLKLYKVNAHNPGMNRILQHDVNFPYEKIYIELLDKIVSDENLSVNFVKLDVEGFEYAVLKGAEQTLRKQHPVMFIELDDKNLKEHGYSARHLLEWLTALGYTSFRRADSLREISESTDLTNCHFDIVVKRN